MKTPEKEREQVDLLIKFTLIMLILIISGFLAMKCSAQNTGYYIWIRTQSETVEQKFNKLDQAQDYLTGELWKTDLVFVPILKDVLNDSKYFEQRTEQLWIYCEKMQVVAKKNGKVKYKRLKK